VAESYTKSKTFHSRFPVSTSVFEQDNLSANPAIITGISQIKDTDKLLTFRLGLSIPIVFPFLYGQKQADIQQAQVETTSSLRIYRVSDC